MRLLFVILSESPSGGDDAGCEQSSGRKFASAVGCAVLSALSSTAIFTALR